jgi:hypothetical protein
MNTMQFSDVNWDVFGAVLAVLLIFGIGYAWLTNVMARKGIDDQTVWMVIGGVLVTVLGASLVIGLVPTVLILGCFAASGLPMVVEFVSRVESAKQADKQTARKASRDLLK